MEGGGGDNVIWWWCLTRRWVCTLYGEVGLKGYAELACKITFSKKEANIDCAKQRCGSPSSWHGEGCYAGVNSLNVTEVFLKWLDGETPPYQ